VDGEVRHGRSSKGINTLNSCLLRAERVRMRPLGEAGRSVSALKHASHNHENGEFEKLNCTKDRKSM
jgi:hypothetical protein